MFRSDPATMTTPTFEGRVLPYPGEPAYDQGLQFDIETLLDRRKVIKLLGYGAISLGLAACAPGATATPGASTSASQAASANPSTGTADCDTAIPEETGGPFPGDGSNGPDVLAESGVVREDITASFGSSTTVAGGVPLTIKLAIQDLGDGCAPLAGAAVYAWHCDREGRYSLYSQGVEGENYLRGVQAAGDDGVVTFQSIFPACYSGRWPHIHFEVYHDLDAAKDSSNKIATSQVALPKDICDQVYATDGYEQSVQNMGSVSLERDNVFGEDGGVHQLGTMSGGIDGGLTVELAVPVNA
jgi:protocatechuate 3,4-dioxygenase beta subunit